MAKICASLQSSPCMGFLAHVGVGVAYVVRVSGFSFDPHPIAKLLNFVLNHAADTEERFSKLFSYKREGSVVSGVSVAAMPGKVVSAGGMSLSGGGGRIQEKLKTQGLMSMVFDSSRV